MESDEEPGAEEQVGVSDQLASQAPALRELVTAIQACSPSVVSMWRRPFNQSHEPEAVQLLLEIEREGRQWRAMCTHHAPSPTCRGGFRIRDVGTGGCLEVVDLEVGGAPDVDLALTVVLGLLSGRLRIP